MTESPGRLFAQKYAEGLVRGARQADAELSAFRRSPGHDSLPSEERTLIGLIHWLVRQVAERS